MNTSDSVINILKDRTRDTYRSRKMRPSLVDRECHNHRNHKTTIIQTLGATRIKHLKVAHLEAFSRENLALGPSPSLPHPMDL